MGKTDSLKKGIEIEKEHKDLYIELKKRLEEEGAKMPFTETEFFTWIAKAHLREKEDYYDLLKKYVENENMKKEIKAPSGTFYAKVKPIREGAPELTVRVSTDEVGDFIAGYQVYHPAKSTKKVAYFPKATFLLMLEQNEYTIIPKEDVKFERGGEVLPKYQVYYMDNDRQKVVVKKNLKYHEAVKLSQKLYSEGLDNEYEVQKFKDGGSIENNIEIVKKVISETETLDPSPLKKSEISFLNSFVGKDIKITHQGITASSFTVDNGVIDVEPTERNKYISGWATRIKVNGTILLPKGKTDPSLFRGALWTDSQAARFVIKYLELKHKNKMEAGGEITKSEEHGITQYEFDVHSVKPTFNHKLIGQVEKVDDNEYYGFYVNEMYDEHAKDKTFKTFEEAEKWVLGKLNKDKEDYIKDFGTKMKLGGDIDDMDSDMINENIIKNFIRFADSFDGSSGYNSKIKGATAKNGDVATGEFEIDHGAIFYNYKDKEGKEYSSKEQPYIRVDLTKGFTYRAIKEGDKFESGGAVGKHYLSNPRWEGELDAFEKNPDKVTIAIAIDKDTRDIKEIIAYAKQSDKEAVTGVINSIYWNHKGYESGRDIVSKMNFIAINNEEDFEKFKRLFKSLKHSLDSLDTDSKAGKFATADENLIFKMSKEYKEFKKSKMEHGGKIMVYADDLTQKEAHFLQDKGYSIDAYSTLNRDAFFDDGTDNPLRMVQGSKGKDIAIAHFISDFQEPITKTMLRHIKKEFGSGFTITIYTNRGVEVHSKEMKNGEFEGIKIVRVPLDTIEKLEHGGTITSVSSEINDSYHGVHATTSEHDKTQIQVTSKFFNTLSEIKQKYLTPSAILQKNEKGEYVLYGHVNKGYFKDGGDVSEGVDLFEDYENIPKNVQKILDKYEDGFVDGDYNKLAKAQEELKKIGYTFDYYLDGQAYDLRKIGQKGKSELDSDKLDSKPFAEGGEITAKYIGEDDWSRKLYKGTNGKTYADVDGELYHITDDGEPLYPARNVKKSGEEPKDDYFERAMEAKRKEFPDMFEKGGEVLETNDTKYWTTEFTNKGNKYSVGFAWGKYNHISVSKLTNNPFRTLGKEFKNIDEAIAHYKDANIRTQLIFAENLAKEKGYVPKFERGGVIAKGTMNTPDGEIEGKVVYNDYWKKYQVNIDGTIYEEFRTPEEAISNLEGAGFKNVQKFKDGGEIGRNRANKGLKGKYVWGKSEMNLKEGSYQHMKWQDMGIFSQESFDENIKQYLTPEWTEISRFGDRGENTAYPNGQGSYQFWKKDDSKQVQFMPRMIYERGGGVASQPSSGGSGKNTATVLIISNKNPLSTQLEKITGQGWNDGAFETLSLPQDSTQVIKHNETGRIFVVFTLNYFSQVDKHVIDDDLSYVKTYYGVTNFYWPRKPTFEQGGDIPSETENTNLIPTPMYTTVKQCLLADGDNENDFIAEGSVIYTTDANKEKWHIKEFYKLNGVNGAVLCHIPNSDLNAKIDDKHLSLSELRNLFETGKIEVGGIEAGNVRLFNICLKSVSKCIDMINLESEKHEVENVLSETQEHLDLYHAKEQAEADALREEQEEEERIGKELHEEETLSRIIERSRKIRGEKELKEAIELAEGFTTEQLADTIAGIELALTDMEEGEDKEALVDYLNGLKVIAEEKSGGEVYAKGGKIKDQYGAKTPEELWNTWNKDQRFHFWNDHDKAGKFEGVALANKDWDALSEDSQRVLENWISTHMRWGQYEKGGDVYPVFDERKQNIKSGVILLTKDTEEEAKKYVSDKPGLFYEKLNDEWAIKKFEKGGEVPKSDIEALANGYKEAILFTNNDDEDESLDRNYSTSDFNKKSDDIIMKMAKQYIIDNQDAIEESGLDYEQVGMDVWYSQAGHGVGFHDRDISKELADKLQKGAKKFGDLSHNVFAQDGEVFIEGMKFESGGDVYEKGGAIKKELNKKFNIGDVVWDKEHKSYGVVLDNFGDPINGDGGELRLDSDGVVGIFTYDKEWNRKGYKLIHKGEKGDAGDGDIQHLKDSANRILEIAKNGNGARPYEDYKNIYSRLLNGEFDKKDKLKKFKIKFVGRKSGSIGKTYKISETVEAVNEEEAVLKLYDKYEHLSQVTINGKPQKFENGGDIDDYKKNLGMVEVIFKDPKYNYSTSVSGTTTEEEARKYFVGQSFNMAQGDNEDNMQKVVDIKFHPKGTYAEGGEIKGMTREEIWKSMSVEKRREFMDKHKVFIKKEHRKDSKNTTLNLYDWATYTYGELPRAIKQSLYMYDYFGNETYGTKSKKKSKQKSSVAEA